MHNVVLPDFLIIPRQLVQDPDMQPLDSSVYGVIYWYTSMRLQTCIATNEQIARLLGASKSGVNKAIIHLVQKGYVQSTYDRKYHTRTLLPLIVFRARTIPHETLALSQTNSTEEAVSHTGQGTIPNGIKKQPQLASPNKNIYEEKKEDILHISSGIITPKEPIKEKKTAYGNEEVNSIIHAFSESLGHIPSDKRPRQVAQNIRQIIHSFITQQSSLFQKLRGRVLTFDYVHTKCWQWYLEKDYALQTENLETFKRKARMYLDYVSTQLHKEDAISRSENSGYARQRIAEEAV